MRSRLKSVEKISEFETDLDNKWVTITYESDLDLKATLNELAGVNSKMKDWEKIDE